MLDMYNMKRYTFCISVVCEKTDKKLPYGKTEEKMKK